MGNLICGDVCRIFLGIPRLQKRGDGVYAFFDTFSIKTCIHSSAAGRARLWHIQRFM